MTSSAPAASSLGLYAAMHSHGSSIFAPLKAVGLEEVLVSTPIIATLREWEPSAAGSSIHASSVWQVDDAYDSCVFMLELTHTPWYSFSRASTSECAMSDSWLPHVT